MRVAFGAGMARKAAWCAGSAGIALLAAGSSASAQAYDPDPGYTRAVAAPAAPTVAVAPPVAPEPGPGPEETQAYAPPPPQAAPPAYQPRRYARQAYAPQASAPQGYAPQGYAADGYYRGGGYAQPSADPRYDDPRYASQGAPPAYVDPRYAASGYQETDQAAYARAYRRWQNGRGPAPQPYSPAPAYAAPTPDAYDGPATAPAAAPGAERADAAPLAPPHLPHRLTEAANAYADYMKKTCAISAAFKSGAGVAEAVKTGAAYEAHQFEDGSIAYAAMTALQEPAFVAGVRQVLRGGDPADFAARLAAQPEAALNIPGAEQAVARAAGALRRHGEHLVAVGAEVKQAAYDVQHQAWSKAEVSNPDGRLAAAKATSARFAVLKGEEAPELIKAVLAETPAEDAAAPSPTVVRALAIAALATLGELKDDQDPRLVALLSEPRSADCLKMAKLNLFQCLSVARPHYEDIFCLGQHAMMDTGQCVVKAAGYTPLPVTLARAGGHAVGK